MYLVSECATELEEFYSKANTVTLGGDAISLYKYTSDIREKSPGTSRPAFKEWMEYGFLVHDTSYADFNDTAGSRSYKTIGERRDVETFMVEVLLDDDAAFEAAYGAYPLILEKYELLKAVWAGVRNELQ